MTRVRKSLLLAGWRGMLGGQIVFRQKGEQIIISAAPVFSQARSQAQQAHHQRFREAAAYARAQMADPQRKALYSAQAARSAELNAYNVAIRDFFHPPRILALDFAGWLSGENHQLLIAADDDVRVEQVWLGIYGPGQILLEAGSAVAATGLNWLYTCSRDYVPGLSLQVKVYDLAGNCTEQWVTTALA